MKPGDRVNEARLARDFRISRNPIREAVASLAARGYLTAAPRRGHFIRNFDRADIDSLFAFRITLELFALEEAMSRMALTDRVALRQIVDGMIAHAAAGRVAEVHDADVAFHRRLIEFAGNGYLLAAYEGIGCEVRMLIAAVKLDRETPLEGARGHLPIVDAIMAGDRREAAATMETHIRRTWSNVVESFPLDARSDHQPGSRRRTPRQA